MSILHKLLGDPNKKIITQVLPIVGQINSFEPELQKLDMPALRAKTGQFKERLVKGETLDDILPEAFAVVRETSRRLTGMRHYDVQMIGGIVLHRGQIAEMGTGEGKTLVATLPVYLNALSEKGVHLVTVNDYLAKRDAVWMGQIYNALGLSVGIIQNQLLTYRYCADKNRLTPDEDGEMRRDDLSEGSATDKERDQKGMFKVEDEYLEICSRSEAYKCDIVYGTNNEFGFDYLRDNMAQNFSDKCQRGFNFGIVDEVDSILIDEARTPLIISAPAQDANEMYYKFAQLVKRLKENEDYKVDEKMRSASLTEIGISKMEKFLNIDNIYAEGGTQIVHHVEQALRAMALFNLNRDYIVDNGEVIIVDEFTGRKMPGRRYSEGLHQAIEAKENVKIQQESQTMATITFQNYFRMYDKLSGMTGTAVTEAEEFGKIYNLEVVVIPPNRPSQRHDMPDRIYKTEKAKYQAIALACKEMQKKGQPVLIGTVSVEKNELLSAYLEQEGVAHEILNAKNHEREGEIVAQAGRSGTVTLATNMAGRGVDIILGGNPPDKELQTKVKEMGGLCVIGTERHESRRIDNQLRGRAGRQGDPGLTQFYLSTQDDLMRIFAGDRIRSVMNTLKVPDDMPIEQKSISRIIESAQKKVEGIHFDSRKHLLEYDDVLNRHREVIYAKRDDVLQTFDKQKNGEEILVKEKLRFKILDMVEQELEQIVSFHTNTEERKDWNLLEMIKAIEGIFPLKQAQKDEILRLGGIENNARLQEVQTRTAMIEFLVKASQEQYEDLLVKQVPDEQMLLEIEKQVLLRSIDNLWIDHLVAVDYLRTGIGLRGYGQRDPLVEYKKETYHMFNSLLQAIQHDVANLIYKVNIGIKLAPSVMTKGNLNLQGVSQTSNGSSNMSVSSNKPKNADGSKVGRNDTCPCGSGKKYKRCCGH
ncbi:MAG: preprotein translocase subunit SecA [Candidatus Magasanikbacteria bacterium CG10_big_fil_rev_8_21_14_0_10_40_10]|uniref:Protein translocase subunit SecA n=1 Tax=Candidatus Magasanikbacteria bacterium CG10_big_fil_rev_8_21_14_0_10_40_10 TaxID=1974648 RepID=A0A2M6W3I8_9BACT|nr:MAG: preprotein translocase subunit SecA [Candidatus Magasanikbacteria bacterium CG10_big_fil_rev_8_21_14_0_10_40_10]